MGTSFHMSTANQPIRFDQTVWTFPFCDNDKHTFSLLHSGFFHQQSNHRDAGVDNRV